MDKKVYLVEYIDEFSEPSEINLMVCESLEEASYVLKDIVKDVCTDLENNGENMDGWKDSNGRTIEECIKKGKFYVDDLFYAEIIEVEPNELVKISAY